MSENAFRTKQVSPHSTQQLSVVVVDSCRQADTQRQKNSVQIILLKVGWQKAKSKPPHQTNALLIHLV